MQTFQDQSVIRNYRRLQSRRSWLQFGILRRNRSNHRRPARCAGQRANQRRPRGHILICAQPGLLGPHLAALIQQAHIPTGIENACGRKNRNDQSLERAGGQLHFHFLDLALVQRTAIQLDHSVK